MVNQTLDQSIHRSINLTFPLSIQIDYRRDNEDTWHSAGYTLDEAYLCTGLEPDKIYR